MHQFVRGHQAKWCRAKVRVKICLLTSVSIPSFYCDFWFDDPESLVLYESVLMVEKSETKKLRDLSNLRILPRIFHWFHHTILY